jgi:hypothetical protein
MGKNGYLATIGPFIAFLCTILGLQFRDRNNVSLSKHNISLTDLLLAYIMLPYHSVKKVVI